MVYTVGNIILIVRSGIAYLKCCEFNNMY